MTPPERRDLKRNFLDRVAGQLKPHGFKLWKQQEVYIRDHDENFREELSMAVQNGTWGLKVVPGLGVRAHKVEEFFYRTAMIGDKYQDRSSTIGTGIESLKGNPLKTYEIQLESPSDLDGAVAEAMAIYQDYAAPYFLRFCDLHAIDAVLNDNPHQGTIHNIMPYDRYARGLIVAKLVNRPNYAELAEIYSAEMKSVFKGFFWSRFEALLRDLETEGSSRTDVSRHSGPGAP